jgi:hypothetical protein
MSTQDRDSETSVSDVDGLVGPHTELNRYGRPTGARYYRCTDCGREVLPTDRDHFSHAPECAHR